jgi:hypothetical protein
VVELGLEDCYVGAKGGELGADVGFVGWGHGGKEERFDVEGVEGLDGRSLGESVQENNGDSGEVSYFLSQLRHRRNLKFVKAKSVQGHLISLLDLNKLPAGCFEVCWAARLRHSCHERRNSK